MLRKLLRVLYYVHIKYYVIQIKTFPVFITNIVQQHLQNRINKETKTIPILVLQNSKEITSLLLFYSLVETNETTNIR
jgi:hypothetical protein